MLRLTRAHPRLLEFEERRSAGVPLIVGAAASAFATLPMLAPGELTPSRAATVLGLLGFAAGCGALGWPRRRRFQIELGPSGFSLGGRWFESAPNHHIRLGSDPPRIADDGRNDYEAHLSLAGGDDRLLLRGSNPGRLMNSLLEIQKRWDVDILPGWGLPAGFFRAVAEPPQSRSSEWKVSEVNAPAHVEQSRIARTLGLGCAFVFTFSCLQLVRRVVQGGATSWFSILLPCVTVALIAVLALTIATAKVRFTDRGKDLRITESVLGITVRQRELPKEDILGAFAVSPHPPSSEARHILLLTRSGAHAIPCSGSAALSIASQVPFSFGA